MLFYQLFLASKFTNPQTSRHEILLGNNSETFLAAINAGRSKGIGIFNTTFTMYWKDRLGSDSYLNTSIHFPHINRAMISLLMIRDYRSSPLDENIEYLSQSISVLSFLLPPKKVRVLNIICMYKNQKNTSTENAVEERAGKCSVYREKLFTKGHQTTYQDAITTISNLVIFLEFIFDEAQSSETSSIIVMLKGIAKVLVTPVFRNYAEKTK